MVEPQHHPKRAKAVPAKALLNEDITSACEHDWVATPRRRREESFGNSMVCTDCRPASGLVRADPNPPRAGRNATRVTCPQGGITRSVPPGRHGHRVCLSAMKVRPTRPARLACGAAQSSASRCFGPLAHPAMSHTTTRALVAAACAALRPPAPGHHRAVAHPVVRRHLLRQHRRHASRTGEFKLTVSPALVGQAGLPVRPDLLRRRGRGLRPARTRRAPVPSRGSDRGPRAPGRGLPPPPSRRRRERLALAACVLIALDPILLEFLRIGRMDLPAVLLLLLSVPLPRQRERRRRAHAASLTRAVRRRWPRSASSRRPDPVTS